MPNLYIDIDLIEAIDVKPRVFKRSSLDTESIKKKNYLGSDSIGSSNKTKQSSDYQDINDKQNKKRKRSNST